MDPLNSSTREPLTMSAGDTFAFHKFLPDYLAADGWSLFYEIVGGINGNAAVIINSTLVAPGNTIFQLTALPAITAQWLPGEYILAGYALNTTDERHQIYYDAISITANLGTDQDRANVTTHAQRMIPLLEQQLEDLAVHSIQDSTVQETEIRRVKRLDLKQQLDIYRMEHRNELAVQNVRNGRSSGNKIRPLANITGGNTPFAGNTWPIAQP